MGGEASTASTPGPQSLTASAAQTQPSSSPSSRPRPLLSPLSIFLRSLIPSLLALPLRASLPTMPPAIAGSTSVLKGAWRPTKIMNMRDLSRDDDFLSHLLVEKLGTGGFPLVVHKMDPSRRLPKTDPEDLMKIVRRVSFLPSPSSPNDV